MMIINTLQLGMMSKSIIQVHSATASNCKNMINAMLRQKIRNIFGYFNFHLAN